MFNVCYRRLKCTTIPTFEELLKTKPSDDPDQKALLNVMYTGVWLQQKVSQTLKPHDLTEPQFNVLRILRGQNGHSMNLYEIQNRMIQKMSNVSRLIDKLLSKGLVERIECKDNRRRVDISITKKGLDLLQKIEPDIQKLYNEIKTNISAEQAQMISAVLDDMRND